MDGWYFEVHVRTMALRCSREGIWLIACRCLTAGCLLNSLKIKAHILVEQGDCKSPCHLSLFLDHQQEEIKAKLKLAFCCILKYNRKGLKGKGRKKVLRDVGEKVRNCGLEVTSYINKLSTCCWVNHISGLGLNFLLRK